MNNNFDPNQQPAYQQPAADVQYQAPLYEQQPAVDPKPILIMAIIGLALGATGACTIAGIILSIMAMSKVKAFVAAGNELAGSAKVAKILSTVGLIVSIAMTVFFVIYITFIVIMAIIGAASSTPSYGYGSGYYY